MKQWEKDNSEHRKQYQRQYREDNPEYVKRGNEYCKQWRKNNPEKIKEQSKQRYKEKPEYFKKYRIKYTYGLSYKDWSEMWENQSGKCAICGNEFTKPSDGFVDHDHKTKKIRSLLCMKCNCGLGNFNDNPELMAEAIKYLKKGR